MSLRGFAAACAAAVFVGLGGCAGHDRGCCVNGRAERAGCAHAFCGGGTCAPADGAGATQALDAARAACSARLDDLHRLAAEAKFDEYFACYTPEATFMGTDATERWSVDEFKAYARPHFDAEKGWTYTPIEGRRFIEVAPGGMVAWFDEALLNAKLGECRGTGVLTRGADGAWRIAHYNLTMPVPNGIIESVADRIRAGS